MKYTGYTLNGWSPDVIPNSIGFNVISKQVDRNGIQISIVKNPNNPNGQSAVYLPGQKYADNICKKLYASWRYQSNIPITFKEYYLDNRLIADRKLYVEYNKPISNKTMFTEYSRAGYKLLGWSKQKTNVYMTTPPPNELKDILFDYKKTYTDDPIGITLYPVLQYNTTCYVFDGNKWKLAVPYVLDGNGNWKQCIGYVFDGNNWKL